MYSPHNFLENTCLKITTVYVKEGLQHLVLKFQVEQMFYVLNFADGRIYYYVIIKFLHPYFNY